MYCVKSIDNPNEGKYGPKELQYLGTFHTLICLIDQNRLDKLNDIYYIGVNAKAQAQDSTSKLKVEAQPQG